MTKHRKKQQDRLTAAAVSGKPFADAWRNFTRHPVSMIAMCVLIVLILTAIVSGFAFDYDKDIVAINPAERMQAPNANHWFGTDDFGRDLFARILYGSRYSLFIGITVSAIAMVLGMLIGASCAYFGGVYDALVMRLMDAIICIPSMLLMLALAAAFGKGMNGIIASLIIVNVPGYARIIRSIVLGVVHQEYYPPPCAAQLLRPHFGGCSHECCRNHHGRLQPVLFGHGHSGARTGVGGHAVPGHKVSAIPALPRHLPGHGDSHHQPDLQPDWRWADRCPRPQESMKGSRT